MRVSIIIPTYNEVRTIRACLEAARRLDGDFEVLVVDGLSDDGTPEVVRTAGVACYPAPRGRAAQMNEGARRAGGAALLFLHADTLLPAEAHQLIEAALSDPGTGGGCFRLAFDADHPVLRFSSFFTRWNNGLFHYGDAAYFVRADLFRRIGGYREELPILEDLDLWRRLLRRTRLVVVDGAVTTSARRFVRHGPVRQQLTNVLIVVLYLLGAHPARLERLYRPTTTKRRTDGVEIREPSRSG